MTYDDIISLKGQHIPMKVPHAEFSYSQYWDGNLPEDHPDIIALLKDVSEEYGD